MCLSVQLLFQVVRLVSFLFEHLLRTLLFCLHLLYHMPLQGWHVFSEQVFETMMAYQNMTSAQCSVCMRCFKVVGSTSVLSKHGWHGNSHVPCVVPCAGSGLQPLGVANPQAIVLSDHSDDLVGKATVPRSGAADACAAACVFRAVKFSILKRIPKGAHLHLLGAGVRSSIF